PAIDHLASNSRLKGVAFVCVATDDDPDAVRRFVHKHKLRMTVLRVAELPPGPFLTEGLPATFLIAPDGRIVVAHEGAAQWDDPVVVDYLEKLAKSSATGR